MLQAKNYVNLKKYLIFLFFILLPAVSASSFTGSFTDYGKDTGSDSLYNYLTIEAGVNINDTSKDYMLLGVLEDSQGNLIEYNTCRSVTATGNQIFILDFNGLEIYRNQVDGPYNLKYIEISSIADCGDGGGMPPQIEHYLIDAHTTQAYTYKQFQEGQAAIYCNSSPCIASSALIKSRDNLTTPEPNAPNTLDGCEDGNAGTYLTSESIESITVTSLNHSFFKIGDTVNAQIQVYCDSTFDKLNFVYSNNTNNIKWNVKQNAQCNSTGIRTLSKTLKLDNNIGQHAVRAIFSFNLNPNIICGQDDSLNEWADTDDVVIYAKGCNSAADCPYTECDQLDQCYSGTYRNYQDISNSCLAEFSCENHACTDYNIVVTDNDGDSYDTECDNDCNDQNISINPGVDEVCNNGIDDDCNSLIDMNDPFCLGKYPIYLTKGWNLMSLPKIDNNSITEISKPFNFEKIIALKEGKWYIYDKTVNSNLYELSEADGFWIKTANNLTVLVDDNSALFTLFNMKKGWNLIGYPSMEEKEINTLFQNVMDDIELIYVYNNEFKSFNPQKPANIIIKPGMGIFVKVKSDVSWYFDNAYKKGQLSFNLTLSQGWNLISLPLSSNKTVSEIFTSNTLYYLENNNWKQMEGTDKVNYSYAYWLEANQGTLPIQGYPLTNINYNINKGWNLINYPLTQDTSVGIFLKNVIANVELVHTYENGQWKTFSPSKPSQLNSLNTLKPGKGLFIKAKNNANWRFNGNELVTT